MFRLSIAAKLLAAASIVVLSTACSRSFDKAPQARLGRDVPAMRGNGYARDGVQRHALDRGASEPGSIQQFTASGNDTVYFSSDSSDLTPEAQQALREQASWLQNYRGHAITVEGHADERGTREYNIALSGRRAQSVKSYLTQHGVEPARIRLTPYGKERPIAVCNDISCWSQNRRAQTVLSSPQSAARN